MSNLSYSNDYNRLKTMGACWFVSYAYWDHGHKDHTVWENTGTLALRKSYYQHSRECHHEWLEKVLKMSDANLNTNTFGLTAGDIKKMAAELIKIV